MLKTYDGISDLNFSVGHPMQVEDFGELKPVFVDPPIERLTPYQTEQLALALMQGNRRLMRTYLIEGSCDCSYSLGDEARFRVNIFRQQGHFSIVMRKLQAVVPTLQSLELPPIFAEIAKGKNRPRPGDRRHRQRQDDDAGRAPERDQRDPVRPCRDPRGSDRIHSSRRGARPLISASSDTTSTIIPTACAPPCARRPRSFSSAKCAIAPPSKSRSWRRRPGHLVLSTLHTVDAGQSINRILGLFSLGEEQQLRIPPRRQHPLHREPAPRAQNRRRPAAPDRNHGPQSAHARNDRARRRRAPQLLRNHRGEFALSAG